MRKRGVVHKKQTNNDFMKKLKNKLANLKDFAKYVIRHEKENFEHIWQYNSGFIKNFVCVFIVLVITFFAYCYLSKSIIVTVLIFCGIVSYLILHFAYKRG